MSSTHTPPPGTVENGPGDTQQQQQQQQQQQLLLHRYPPPQHLPHLPPHQQTLSHSYDQGRAQFPFSSSSSSQHQYQHQQLDQQQHQQQAYYPNPYPLSAGVPVSSSSSNFLYQQAGNNLSFPSTLITSQHQHRQQHQQQEVNNNKVTSSNPYNSMTTSLPPIGSSYMASVGVTAHESNNNALELRPTESKCSTTFWEDENTICYQVEVRGVLVSRREDTDFINGTKLLNLVGMTRGRRDGILKSEKTRYVVKIGAMNLKGVWIPFDRAMQLATSEDVIDLLYPLFVRDIKTFYLENVLSHSKALQDMTATSNDDEGMKPRKKRTSKIKREDKESQQQISPSPYNVPYGQYQQGGPYYSSQMQPQQQYLQYNTGGSSYHPLYQQRPQQQQQQQQQQPQYTQQYLSLLPQQQEYVQQYYNYYRQFQPQPQQQQQQQQAQQGSSSGQQYPNGPYQHPPQDRQ